MGGSKSKAVVEEQERWEEHELKASQALRDQNWSRAKLGKELRLCWQDMPLKDPRTILRHYFVTDMETVVEFGGVRYGIRGGPARVHKTLPAEYRVEKVFEQNQGVIDRLYEVLGATDYSLLLRNSEHFARYVQGGGWTSMMTVEGSPIYELFREEIANGGEKAQLINMPPVELRKQHKPRAMYRKQRGFLSNEGCVDMLSQEDVNKGFNVVFLGPTGAGKSHLINLLFNMQVSLSAGGAKSVTTHMQVIQGRAEIHGRETLVNVVDTIGFCDTKIPPEQLHKIIKQYIKAAMMVVHKVVIVCSGRLEPTHRKAIREFLDWLRYNRHPANFGLVYTKCEDMPPEDRHHSLSSICRDLGMITSYQRWWDHPDWRLPSSILKDRSLGDQVSSVPMNVAVGFPPAAAYQDIEEDLLSVVDLVCTPPERPIEVDQSGCAIL